MDQTDLHILTIGTDETIFDKDSLLRQRVWDYGTNFTSFHVFCKSGTRRPTEAMGKITIHPLPKFWPLFISAGYRTGSLLLCGGGKWVVSSENTSLEGVLAFLLSRRWGAPLQIQMHTDVFSPWFRRAGWKERIRFGFAKFLVPRADCIRAVSERIRKSLMSNVKCQMSNVNVLPIYTDISKFLGATPDPVIEERFKNYDFKMIAVGRFVDKEKNFSMLIEMMRDFIKIYPKALLVLVGYGPDKEKYQYMVERYKLEKNVIIGNEEEVKRQLFTSTERTNYNWQRGENENRGFHSDRANQLYQGRQRYIERSEDIIEGWRNDLPSFYKSFDLYLMSSNYEGWGRTVIEAMASGLPVVMTDVGLAREVVKNGENGVVVPVADKGVMLQAVTNLYKNPELRAKFSEAGLATVKNLEPKSKEDYLKTYAASYCNSKN